MQAGNAQAFDGVVDLQPYMNTSACTVSEEFSVERAYMLFRALGLRHLIVVDASQHVKGMITRKVGFALPDVQQNSAAAVCITCA